MPRPRGFGLVLREMATADAVPFVYFLMLPSGGRRGAACRARPSGCARKGTELPRSGLRYQASGVR